MKRKPDNQADLPALFESGTALDHAWVEFSQGLDRFAFRALRTAPANDDSLRKEDPKRYEQISMGWLPKTWESRQKKLELRTRDARADLLDGIYRGDFIALGFRTLPDGTDELARVPRQHFYVDFERENPFPDIDWKKGELRLAESSYFDIHVHARVEDDPTEQLEASADPDSNTSELRTTSTESIKKAKPGRPSKKNVIMAAIKEYSRIDPDLDQSKRDRFKAYRTYISEKGYNPLRDSGFSDKTIEKFETEFRRKTK